MDEPLARAVVVAACAVTVGRCNSWPIATLLVAPSLGFAGYAGLDVMRTLL